MFENINYKKKSIYSNINIGQKISDAIKGEYWLNIILWVLWTSVPVSFIGSYIMYGEMLSSNTFFKLATYTLVTCVSTVIIQITRKVFFIPKELEAYKIIINVNEILFKIYFQIRDEYIKSFPEEQQKHIMALWVLSNPTSNPNMIKKSILDLTNNPKLASSIETIEIFRKQGIISMVNIENKKIEKELNQAYDSLKEKYPGIAELMKEKFLGNSPSLANGKKRPFGFIEKAINAEEYNNLDYLNSEDIMSIILLAIEFLSQRSILVLSPKYKKNSDFKETKEKLENLLSELKSLRRIRNRLTKTLINKVNLLINNKKTISLIGVNSTELNYILDITMKKYCKLKEPPQLNHIKILCNKIYNINNKIKILYKKTNGIKNNYNKLFSNSNYKIPWKIKENKNSTSVIIKESYIKFHNKREILNFAVRIEEILKDADINIQLNNNSFDKLKIYKKIAIEIINIMDEKLKISGQEQQLAIETSKEINISIIDIDSTAKVKYKGSKTLVEEIEQISTDTVHNIAYQLINYFNVELEKETIEYLEKKYGANSNFLKSLIKEKSTRKETEANKTLKLIKIELIKIEKWLKILNKK